MPDGIHLLTVSLLTLPVGVLKAQITMFYTLKAVLWSTSFLKDPYLCLFGKLILISLHGDTARPPLLY